MPAGSSGGSRHDDAERFRQLYKENYTPLIGYARRRTPTSDDAADVIAETFLVAWRNLQKVPPGEGTTPWLFGIARGVLANQARGARRRSQLAQRVNYELQSQTESQAPSTTDFNLIAEAFTRLSPMDQEILRLSAWEGLGPTELAIALDCSLGAAKVRLFRARARMRKSLERREGRQSTLDQMRSPNSEMTTSQLSSPSPAWIRRHQ
jgi:RNA polymerase sigma factor (sigma-70 family)